MDKPSKKSATSDAAVVSVSKSGKKRKRDSKNEIEKAVAAKNSASSSLDALKHKRRICKTKRLSKKQISTSVSTSKSDVSSDSSDSSNDQSSDSEYEASSENPVLGELNSTLFFHNLSFIAGKDDVKNFFREFGDVDVYIKSSNPNAAEAFVADEYGQSGYLKFSGQKDAQNALKSMNGKDLFDHSLKLVSARHGRYNAGFRSVFIRGLPKSEKENKIHSSLESHFSRCGEITRIYIPKDGLSGNILGTGFIDFKDDEHVDNAVKLNGIKLEQCPLFVTKALPRLLYVQQAHEPSIICVQGFDPYQKKERISVCLENRFSPCGEISRVDIPDCRVKWYAFIHFRDVASAKEALKLDEHELQGGDHRGRGRFPSGGHGRGRFGPGGRGRGRFGPGGRGRGRFGPGGHGRGR